MAIPATRGVGLEAGDAGDPCGKNDRPAQRWAYRSNKCIAIGLDLVSEDKRNQKKPLSTVRSTSLCRDHFGARPEAEQFPQHDGCGAKAGKGLLKQVDSDKYR